MLKNILDRINIIKNDQNGFNISELMVAASIIALLAVYPAAGKYESSIKAARDAQRKYNIKQVETALYLYYNDNGEYPSTADKYPSILGWQSLSDALEGKTGEGPDAKNIYMPEAPVDPLSENSYVFKYSSDGQKFTIEYETEDKADASPLTVKGY